MFEIGLVTATYFFVGHRTKSIQIDLNSCLESEFTLYTKNTLKL